jgi:nucleotide-binding universal stress UspA family protein
MSRIRRILHASDFSRASKAAFAQAIQLARTNRAELTVVHVFSPVVQYMGEGYALPQVYEQLLASTQAQARKQLDKLLARAKREGVRAKSVLVEGVPHDRIVRAARSTRADLLVLGTHGHTGLARFFLGSVAARVVATAPCPVLTVRGR